MTRNQFHNRTDNYVRAGLPIETAIAMVAYESDHAGETSTFDEDGRRIPA